MGSALLVFGMEEERVLDECYLHHSLKCFESDVYSFIHPHFSPSLFPLLVNQPHCFVAVTRNCVKFAQFRAKKMNTNPGRGPFHFKSPARMVWRTIRGMVHQKSARGQDALARLSTFEGIPHPYDKKKRVVIPAALRVMRLKSGRNFCTIADIANANGWKHKDLLKKLEDKRKVKAEAFYQKKKAKVQLKQKAIAAAEGELAKVNEVLAASGY